MVTRATAPEPIPAPRFNQTKVWLGLVAGLAVVLVVATCGFLSYQLVEEERAGRNAQAPTIAPTEVAPPRDISSRDVDPEPLKVGEVFPSDEIIINPAEPPYVVLGTDKSKDCATAAADALAALLDDLGCSQVVRAAIRSPDEDYVISGGIFNLETEQDAEEAYDSILPLIEDGSGRFLGLLAGDGTESLVLSETRVGVDFRGHFLMYAVIARADGAGFSASDDRHADVIFWDMIEVHLRSGVLEARTEPVPAEDAEEAGD